MTGISNLVINMYRETAKFDYEGKIRQRTVALEDSCGGEYINGYILKHYEVTGHIVYDVRKNQLFIMSFAAGRIIKRNSHNRDLFRAVKQVIDNYMMRIVDIAA